MTVILRERSDRRISLLPYLHREILRFAQNDRLKDFSIVRQTRCTFRKLEIVRKGNCDGDSDTSALFVSSETPKEEI